MPADTLSQEPTSRSVWLQRTPGSDGAFRGRASEKPCYSWRGSRHFSYTVPHINPRVSAGLAQDLTPYVNADSTLKAWTQSTQGIFNVDNKYFCLPTARSPFYVLANKKVLDAAGVTLPTKWTIDDYHALARKLSKGNTYGAFAPPTILPYAPLKGNLVSIHESAPARFNIGGVIPSLSVKADPVPFRSECGIGALMAWANRLWFVTYVSHTRTTGSGTGLYEVDEDLTIRKRPESVVGTYANRLMHPQSNQVIVGPHIIDIHGQVRTFTELVDHRIAATMEHLHDPEHKVYFLTMEGIFLEADVATLECRVLYDLVDILEVPADAQPHFKSGHTSQGRVVVTNNTYDERDYLGTQAAGRLAEWDGERWSIIERTGFNEVTGRKNFGAVIFATGWDRRSAILRVLVNGVWQRYRLPKASHTFDHFWQTEWPRIREVEHERFLMDCHGMFYEMSPSAYGGHVWGIRPISTHLRVVPDFCAFRGFLVMGGNQVTPTQDSNLLVGEPQAGLWIGKTDDLWQFGKPKGWGGPWWDEQVSANQPSDPYLMTGFDQKVVHLYHEAGRTVAFKIEVDILGNGSWKTYDTLSVPAGQYIHHEFPSGFSAHWVRLTVDHDCQATAYFNYM